MAQTIALKGKNKNKRRRYSKQSKNTLKCHREYCIDLRSKGFFPLDEYMRRKGIPEKNDKPTPQSDAMIL
jgi:hypothetical protein